MDKKTKPPPRGIQRLPDEILSAIFWHLDVPSKGQVAQVCQRWLALSRQPSVWRGLRVMLFLEGDPNHCLITRWTHWPFPPIHTRITHLPQFDDVTVSMFYSERKPLKIKSVRLLAQQLTNLVSLRFDFYEGGGQLPDDSMGIVRDHLKCLRYFYLTGVGDISDVGMSRLAGHGYQDDGFPRLVTLELDYCKGLTNLSLKYLSVGQPRLQHLKIGFARRVTNVGIVHLSHLTSLTHLWLSECPLVDGAAFEPLSQMMALRELRLNDILLTDEGLAHLAAGGSRIKTLDMGSLAFGESGITAACGDHLARLGQLEILKAGFSKINDSTLARLTKSHIRELILCGCEPISDEGLRHLANMAHLQEVDLRYCMVGDGGLEHLVGGRAAIVVLAISGKFTGMGMAHLAKLASLTTLSLTDCCQLTGVDLAQLGGGQARITSLKVVRGRQLDDDTLGHIARNLATLRRLELNERHVSDEGMHLAARYLMHLQVFEVDYQSRVDHVRHLRRENHY